MKKDRDGVKGDIIGECHEDRDGIYGKSGVRSLGVEHRHDEIDDAFAGADC